MVHPGLSGNGKRICINVRKVVRLKEILRVAEMPPDIGIAHSATRHHKFEHDNENRQNQEERWPLTQPKADCVVGRLLERLRSNVPRSAGYCCVVDLGLALE